MLGDGLLPDFYCAVTGWVLPAAGDHGVEPQPELADEQTQQVAPSVRSAVVIDWTGCVFRMPWRVMANGSFWWWVRCTRQLAHPMALPAEGPGGNECRSTPAATKP